MALYNFVDTWKQNTQGTALLSESFTINGTRIEEVVSGFRTLYAKGRESMSADVDLLDSGRTDGSVFNYKRYPERVITVGYQIKAADAAAFREAYNQLASVLNVEQAQFIFDDEPDKFFIGTPAEMGDVEAGRNTVTGEFTIVCADPFKYSVTEKTVNLTRNTDNTFNYDGTVPVIPEITGIMQGATGGDDVGTASWFESYSLNDAMLIFSSSEDAESADKLASMSIGSSGHTSGGWTRYAQETTFDDTYYQGMAQGRFTYTNTDPTNCYRFIAQLTLDGNGASYSPAIEIIRNYSDGIPQTELRFKMGDDVVYKQYIDDNGSNDFPFRLSFERGATTQAVAKGYLTMIVTYQFGDLIYSHKTSVDFTTSDSESYRMAGAVIEYAKHYMSTADVTTRAGSMFVTNKAVYNMAGIMLYGVPHVVDVKNARLYIGGLYTPYPNNPANNWADFKIVHGTNHANCRSMGIASGYFSAVLKYREVYI